MHVGLIGGIGVAATLAYYDRLIRAAGDGAEVTIVHAQIGDLVRNFASDDRSAQARVYAGLIDRLKAAGCDVAAITSLGGHFCFDETAALASLPLVSGVTPLDAYLERAGVATAGLLGTARVMETGLYGQLRKTRALAPEGDLAAVGAAYQAMARRGTATAEERAFFLGEGAGLIRRGADAVVLAGTDLNLAFDGETPGYKVIDALDAHVAVLADLATGRRALADVM
ncbi:MAG: aspartate/glutamate racemase family protein [Rhodobacteraceae bacterium]|nr:MAG: aspartate/glutamate racemase family protein [Paracoccaceae bacterium]